MIAELKYEGKQYRFRIAYVSNVKRYGTKDADILDYELTCISEEFPDKLKCKVFDHFAFKQYVNDGIIKIID